MNPFAIGENGTDVRFESLLSPDPTGDPGNEAAGDIFKTPAFELFGSYILDHIAYGHILNPANKENKLYRDEVELGLQALEFDDELNALDIKPTVPEPSSILGIFALGGLGLTQLRKKR
ncbi:MAG: PEP-CTERM sorting domain-containing protein [Crocosphaera sp.]